MGDIESLPFLEAVRQMSLKLGPQQHRLRAPDLRAVDRRRRRAQDQADPAHGAEAARDRHPARRAAVPRRPPRSRTTSARRSRCSPTCRLHGVISVWDVDTIYKVPRMLHEQGLDELICMKLQLLTRAGRPAALGPAWCTRSSTRSTRSRIAMCGKYTDLSDSYKSLNEALRHAGIHNHARVQHRVRRLRDARRRTASASWRASTPSWCPAASASAASKARSSRRSTRASTGIPYLGICLGMQVATIEFARHMAGLDDANSTEFDPTTPHPVIALIDEWQDRDGTIQKRDANSDLGGTMRLGAQSSDVKPGTLAHQIYGDVGQRAPPPPLRGQRALPRAAAAGRPGDLGDHAAREADRDRRAAARARTPGSSACSSTPSSSPRRGTAIRCSSAT